MSRCGEVGAGEKRLRVQLRGSSDTNKLNMSKA